MTPSQIRYRVGQVFQSGSRSIRAENLAHAIKISETALFAALRRGRFGVSRRAGVLWVVDSTAPATNPHTLRRFCEDNKGD